MAQKITMGSNAKLNVPNNPIIPFIEGDGIGPEIWKVAVKVFDTAVEKAYRGTRKIEWKEMFAGEVLDKNSLPIKYLGLLPNKQNEMIFFISNN